MHLHGKKKKFVELVGRIMVRWGYTDTEGLIYGLLLISEKPMTISDLLKLTDLSRTSISTSLKRLAGDDMVSVRKIKKVKYFTPNPRFVEKFMEQPKQMLEKEIKPMVKILEEMERKSEPGDYREKLEKMRRNVEELKKLLEIFVEIEERGEFRT